MAVFTRNDDFNDIQHQLNYVSGSLGFEIHGQKQDMYGCSRRGDGWSSPFYRLYCNRCQVEIEKPWIDPNDEEKLERCTECKQANDLCTRKERKEELQQRMDDFYAEEETSKKQMKRWRLFRSKFPLSLLLNDGIIDSDDDYDSDISFDSDDSYSVDQDDLAQLEYDEMSQWETTGIDLEEYVINNWYVPNKECGDLNERCKALFEKFKIIKAQKDKAIKEKNLGNDAFKNRDFKVAIEHYTKAIMHRTDFKIAYTNRALMYHKLKKYEKCITDCSTVIAMIKIVNPETMLKSNEMFKAYLRRASSYKAMNKIDESKADLAAALVIKPKDGAANKLNLEIKQEMKRNKIRQKLQNFGKNNAHLNDFDTVFNLSMQFLVEATLEHNADNFDLENRDSNELLRRLYVFMCREKKYCVRFADQNGMELCLEYLSKKFVALKGYKAASEKSEKLQTLIRPFSLLNSCCDKAVNQSELKKKKHFKALRTIIVFTMNYFAQMKDDLQVQAMRFIALVMTVECVREHIAEKRGAKMMEYFLKFQKKTNPKKQNTNAIRALFETFSNLFCSQTFCVLLYKQRNPYLYEVFMHSLFIYDKAMRKNEDKNSKDYENMQFAISVLLDGLSLVFDAEACLMRNVFNENTNNERALMKETNKMIQHFVANKNINTYMKLLTDFLKFAYEKYIKCDQKEKEKNFSQVLRSLNVLVQLCDPSYPTEMHRKLYEFSIDKIIFSLMLQCKNPEKYDGKMNEMMKLTKYRICMWLDAMSAHKQFDKVYAGGNENVDKKDGVLPFFWKFVMDIFNEQYRERRVTPKLMEAFTMNKSRCIRCVYRWTNRRNLDNDRCGVMELMIKKYFDPLCEWLSYSDEQVMANAPLIMCEFVKYSIKFTKARKVHRTIAKALSVTRLKSILKLMTTNHHAIQYNAMLLMANIIDFDPQVANVCSAIGATALVKSYRDKHQSAEQQKIHEQYRKMGERVKRTRF